jgi:hypothetical protein
LGDTAQTGREQGRSRCGRSRLAAAVALVGLGLGLGFAGRVVAGEARTAGEPVVLVPGYLWQVAGEPAKLRRQLLDSGVAERDLFLVGYPVGEEPAVAGAVVADAIEQALALYPPGAKARVLSWSLGHFVALYAVLEHGLVGRVSMLVGIAGAAHGTEHSPLCSIGLCGRTLPLLMPADNDFVRSFYARHPEVAALPKCALYSPDDGVLEPFDSGAFPDGVRVEVPGVAHTRKFDDRSYVDAMLGSCW